MVKNKSTVINNNNKNIIQILYDKPKKKQKQENNNQDNKKQKTNNFMKDNAMESQPFNLVNSFPNSSGLGMDRRARFLEAMRDPISTKSPYSIFDNGSNTFAREGNTVGAEQAVMPTISQSDYFQQPRTLIRPPQRVPVGSFVNVSAGSPINRFDDGLSDEMSYEDFDDERSQASSNYVNGWERQQRQESLYNDYEEEEPIYTAQSFGIGPAWNSEVGNVRRDQQINGPELETRFSNKPPMAPPVVNIPYQRAGQMQMSEDPIEVEALPNEKRRDGPPLETRFSNKPPMPPVNMPIEKYPIQGEFKMMEDPVEEEEDEDDIFIASEQEERRKARDEFEKTENEVLTEEQEEYRRKKEEQQATYNQLAKDYHRQKAIQFRYQNIVKDLKALLKVEEDLRKQGANPKPAKVRKADLLREKITNLISDPEFIEFTNAPTLKNMTNAKSILAFVEEGSKAVAEQIKRIEQDKKESPIKRVAPVGKAKIKTLSSISGGEKQAGGVSSKAKQIYF